MTLFGKETSQNNIVAEIIIDAILLAGYAGVLFASNYMSDDKSLMFLLACAVIYGIPVIFARLCIVDMLQASIYFRKKRIFDALVNNEFTTIEEIAEYTYNNCSIFVRLVYTKKIMNNFIYEVYNDRINEIFAKVCLQYPKVTKIVSDRDVLYESRFSDLDTYLKYKSFSI